MALKISTPPAASITALNEAMSWFHQNVKPATKARALLREPVQNIPHKIFNLRRDDILVGKGLEAAELTGWRFVFTDDQEHLHVAEIQGNEKDAQYKLGQFNEGQHVNHFVENFNKLLEAPALASNDYEVRVLRVPACYVMALWLKNNSGSSDLLIPLEPVHENFEANKLYSAEEFMQVLRKTAEEMASAQDRDN